MLHSHPDKFEEIDAISKKYLLPYCFKGFFFAFFIGLFHCFSKLRIEDYYLHNVLPQNKTPSK